MISQSTLSELHILALVAAPELSAGPLYICEPPADYPSLPHAQAFTTFLPDYAFRRALIERGAWIGPGIIVVLCPADTDRESLAGLVLHEVAHNLPFTPPLSDYEPTGEEVSQQSELVALWAAEPENPLSAKPPWHPYHDREFIRRCLHLQYRAERVGVDLLLPAIHFAAAHYGVSGAWKYKRAIGDEPQRMMGCSFAEIQATEAPAAFLALWESDVAAWDCGQKIRNKHPKEIVT